AQVLQVQALPEAELSEAQQRRAALPLPPVLAPRTVFDGYRIERELHASHRSHVYLATDLDNGERVVLKT
ncbi:MAG: bifunctional protein-serine/threonine kinase/phosphatase, partial [Ottowia sp.]|nr:bifunctional protein-serine/threonine kinase/phosphatase [Ottowia sp.]